MKKALFTFGLAVLALAACNKNPEGAAIDYSRYAVRVEPVITRATETNFETQDAIGLTLSREAGTYAENACLTYDGSAFQGDLKWYAEGADAATLKAYYPYAETTPATFTVAADQSEGTSSSDFISAVKENVLPSANAISMVFKHQLSRLVVKVTNNAGYTLDDILLKGAIPTAVIAEDLTASVDATAAAADIKPYKNGDDYYVILPAQTVALTAEVVAAGVTMSQKLASATLEAGKQYTINMIVNATDIKVVLSGEIENWTDGGELTAGETSDEPALEEHLDENYILYDGDRYSVKKLSNNRWIMTQSMRYVPAGKTVSSDPTDGNGIWYPYSSDGSAATALTDDASAETYGYLYDHQVAFAAEITADNFKGFEGCQGICPKGWHIPTRAEFLAIVGYSNKADGESDVAVDQTAVYYDSDYNAARIKTLNADGMNITFAGSLMRNTNTATGKFLATITKSTTCSVDDWIGANAVSYFIGSTGHTPSSTETNRQFMSLMTTFTSTYTEGRLHVAYSNYLGGYSLRCIRDAE